MRLVVGNDMRHQVRGTHFLCANVECRCPLERPYTLIELNGHGRKYVVAVCEACRAAAGKIGAQVEIDHVTRYDQ